MYNIKFISKRLAHFSLTCYDAQLNQQPMKKPLKIDFYYNN